MPSVKEFKDSSTEEETAPQKKSAAASGTGPTGKKRHSEKSESNRRLRSEVPPQSEPSQPESTDDGQLSFSESSDSSAVHSGPADEAAYEQQKSSVTGAVLKKFKFIQDRIPSKATELVNSIVEDWQKDGEFQGLPVGHPLAQILVSKGLKKAKNIEKKLEAKGVFLVAQMGAQYVKTQLDKAPWKKK
ncbi:MAG: hypothetical protein ACOYOK_13855 [Pseudobdellovibrionaceae bacterium]